MTTFSADAVRRLGDSLGLTFHGVEANEFAKILDVMGGLVDALNEAAPILGGTPARADARRDMGRLATRQEDPLNAVVRWCSVAAETPDGPLSGMRIGLKDVIQVAGIPMTAGWDGLHGFVPEQDSTVTQRLIEAGAEIVAMLNMEALAWSAGGETSSYGAVLNPWDPTRTASGSSGGAAAALAYDNIDATIGGDQGGSIRLPSSWCGVLGLKGTRGLVPYTGAVPIEYETDTLAPMTRDVGTMATILDVLAGPDGLDPRQRDTEFPFPSHVRAVEQAGDRINDIRIGVLAEGFGYADEPDAIPGSSETVEAVKAAIDRLGALGAKVTEVSVPEHAMASLTVFPLLVMGQFALLQHAGLAIHSGGRFEPDFAVAFGKAIQAAPDTVPDTAKYAWLLGAHMLQRHQGRHYALAKNFGATARAAYDQALQDVDVLVMPTAAHPAITADPSATISERVLRGVTCVRNTGQFNITGHPALSIPAADVDGLPAGLMLVGRHGDDARLLSIARTYEMTHGWLPKGQALGPRRP